MPCGYYKDKVEANVVIDTMIKEGKPIENIYFKIDTLFGFSNKFVDKRVSYLKDLIKGIEK